MSRVCPISIRLDWTGGYSFSHIQTVGPDRDRGLVDDGDYTITGTPDQLLDLAALLIDAANLVLAVDVAGVQDVA